MMYSVSNFSEKWLFVRKVQSKNLLKKEDRMTRKLQILMMFMVVSMGVFVKESGNAQPAAAVVPQPAATQTYLPDTSGSHSRSGFHPSPCLCGQHCSGQSIETCIHNGSYKKDGYLPDTPGNSLCLCGQHCSGKSIQQCPEYSTM